MELSAAFTGLYISSGRRLALFTCFCGIISVQQSAGRNSFLLSVSYDCFIWRSDSGNFLPVFYQRYFCCLPFSASRAGICNRYTFVLVFVLPVLCETANVVLLTNEHLSLEQFLVPAANLVVSGILLLGILKFFPEQWYSGTEYAIWTWTIRRIRYLRNIGRRIAQSIFSVFIPHISVNGSP